MRLGNTIDFFKYAIFVAKRIVDISLSVLMTIVQTDQKELVAIPFSINHSNLDLTR